MALCRHQSGKQLHTQSYHLCESLNASSLEVIRTVKSDNIVDNAESYV